MIGFARFAALLAGLALWFVLPPRVRGHSLAAPRDHDDGDAEEGASNLAVLREQLAQIDAELANASIDAAQHRLARGELERRVLEEEVAVAGSGTASRGPAKRTAWALGLALPLFAIVTYAWLGQPGAVGINNSNAQRGMAAGGAPAQPGDPTEQDMRAMVDKLAQRMQADPGDPKGWAVLGRSYAALQRFNEASAAYARAVALDSSDAQLLVDYADALAMTQGQSAIGEPTRLIERALQIDPGNLKALALAGSAAMERQDFAVAVGYWKLALQKVQPGSELANAIERSMNEAQEAVRAAPASAGAKPGGTVTAQAAPAAPAATPAPAVAAAPLAVATASASAIQVSGRVSLAPALAARVQPGDTVFIFARAADGPRMPLAILRRNASELPITFTLDDSMAMSPEMKLSKFPSVVVAARISRSGDAMPRSGDLQGQSGAVKAGSAGLEIVIDGVRP